MSSADEVAWNTLNNWAFDIIKAIASPTNYAGLQVQLAELTPIERGIAGLKWTEAEVNNGGFVQLYDNSLGFWAAEAVSGFELIGRADFAKIVALSLQVFPDVETACIQQSAQRFFDAYEDACERLEELSDSFWDLEKNSSMGPNILAFAHAHVIDGVVK